LLDDCNRGGKKRKGKSKWRRPQGGGTRGCRAGEVQEMCGDIRKFYLRNNGVERGFRIGAGVRGKDEAEKRSNVQPREI